MLTTRLHISLLTQFYLICFADQHSVLSPTQQIAEMMPYSILFMINSSHRIFNNKICSCIWANLIPSLFCFNKQSWIIPNDQSKKFTRECCRHVYIIATTKKRFQSYWKALNCLLCHTWLQMMSGWAVCLIFSWSPSIFLLCNIWHVPDVYCIICKGNCVKPPNSAKIWNYSNQLFALIISPVRC